MSKPQVSAVAGLAAAILLVGGSTVACGNTSPTASSSAGKAPTSSSATAGPSDYTSLLIPARDIAAVGDTFTAGPPTRSPNGIAGVTARFGNQTGTRQIRDTILILPDASSAAASLAAAQATLGTTVGSPQPAPVASDGTMVSGTSPDRSKAVTVLMFTEGKAFATVEFDSAPNDPVPSQFVFDVGQQQDTAIRNGLPR